MFAWGTKGPGLVFRTLGASGVGGGDLGLHPLPLSAPGLLCSSGQGGSQPALASLPVATAIAWGQFKPSKWLILSCCKTRE